MKKLLLASLCLSVFMLSGCQMFSFFGSKPSADASQTQAAEEKASADKAAPAASAPKAAPSAAASQSSGKAAPASLSEKDKKIYNQLSSFATQYIKSCNKHVVPSKAAPSVIKRDGKMVAYYMEIEEDTFTLELIPSKEKTFSHIAKLRYIEHKYESVGKTKSEALKGSYSVVSTRRLTELPRYVKGKWVN